ncbi:ABC transporter permease [Paenibacillus thailandensis]|uniref:ABC transporter permease n=1 Tax=Paenibacillus thailandensis TaxID=393250 RepID=UPI00362E9DFD
MNSFWTVVGFTVKNKLRGKAFLITTLVMVIIISIGTNLPYIISLFNKDQGQVKVTSIGYAKSGQADGIAGTKLAEELESYYASQEQADIKLVAYPDAGGADNNEAQLKKAVAANEIDGYLTFGPVQANGLPAVYYNLENLMSDSASSSLSGALQVINVNRVLQDAGISEEQKKLLFEPVKVETVQVPIGEGAGQGSERTPEQQGMAIGLTTVISLMLFMGIMITGQMITGFPPSASLTFLL